MHDIGLNAGQLELSVRQMDDVIQLASAWGKRLLEDAEGTGMEAIGSKLEAALASLSDAREALAGYPDAIESDHNAVGTVRLV
ncbi:hypothetical protein K6V98_04605 [Collinsella sp. AGMB00827]|uniref:Uncharacterized protein n=1 Tax=Collinsella ureilytica TaxID=2869515 RepID=A0ABS7MKM1_9ACTN|nr:hypothetical protein [Collinsella urealyticum]MBY4797635.1 hypothetical protein [Collinsella urealyticum]